MKLPGSDRVRRMVRRIAPKALILMYHRVAVQPSDPQLLCVTPAHFAEHMQVLRRNYHPVRLQSLRQRQVYNFWPFGSVAITFDDGYADNFQPGCAILEAQDLPATIFVTSGKVDAQQEFWWDELDRIFLFTAVLPAHLEILINRKAYIWDFDGISALPTAPAWNVLSESVPTQRHQAYLDLMKALHDLDVDAREAALSELASWAGMDRNQGRQAALPIKGDELRGLPSNGLIEIGAHTVNHVSLSVLPVEAQEKEIIESKIVLEKILDRPVVSFSYPFGGRSDYTPDTVRLVREAGFSCACSNFQGRVTMLSDPYQLPRFIVRDWDGETFARQLREWFGG
ncbi:MAG: polysaccharide deacetylase family protein [Anaerolineales bacterium]